MVCSAETEQALTPIQPMTKDDMLAASQAQMIYIIMMIIESGLRKEEWVRELLVLSGVSFLLETTTHELTCVQSICQRMWILATSDETSAMLPSNNSSMSWEDWIYQESKKRYAQMLLRLSCMKS